MNSANLLCSVPSLAAGPLSTYFYASQRAWIQDDSPLKLCVKSRQTGFSFANSFHLLLLVNARDARLDAHIVSRDQYQARLQAEDCLLWADILHLGAKDLGEVILDARSGASAYALQFANGRRIYSLSSNPNALAGKRGHVTLDEFALHQDQRLLYRVAKPVTTWGGHPHPLLPLRSPAKAGPSPRLSPLAPRPASPAWRIWSASCTTSLPTQEAPNLNPDNLNNQF